MHSPCHLVSQEMLLFLNHVLNQGVLEDAPGCFIKEFEYKSYAVSGKILTDPALIKAETVTAVSVHKDCVKGVLLEVADATEKSNKKKPFKWMPLAWIQDATTLRCNEFFHEVAMGFLCSKYMSDVPAFQNAAFIAGSHAGTGTSRIAFSKCPGEELEKILLNMNVDEMCSVIRQVLVGIRVGQERLRLKHHDLHLGNVLVEPTDIPEWNIQTPEGVIHIKSHGLKASIIDFGLSFATDPVSGLRLSRVDTELMVDETDSDCSWGVWSSSLDGDEGYDVAMLVESLAEELFHERPLDVSKIAVVSALQKLVNVNFTDRGRPAEKTRVDWGAVFAATSP